MASELLVGAARGAVLGALPPAPFGAASAQLPPRASAFRAAGSPRSRPLRWHARSRRRAGFQRGASLRETQAQGGNRPCVSPTRHPVRPHRPSDQRARGARQRGALSPRLLNLHPRGARQPFGAVCLCAHHRHRGGASPGRMAPVLPGPVGSPRRQPPRPRQAYLRYAATEALRAARPRRSVSGWPFLASSAAERLVVGPNARTTWLTTPVVSRRAELRADRARMTGRLSLPMTGRSKFRSGAAS